MAEGQRRLTVRSSGRRSPPASSRRGAHGRFIASCECPASGGASGNRAPRYGLLPWRAGRACRWILRWTRRCGVEQPCAQRRPTARLLLDGGESCAIPSSVGELACGNLAAAKRDPGAVWRQLPRCAAAGNHWEALALVDSADWPYRPGLGGRASSWRSPGVGGAVSWTRDRRLGVLQLGFWAWPEVSSKGPPGPPFPAAEAPRSPPPPPGPDCRCPLPAPPAPPAAAMWRELPASRCTMFGATRLMVPVPRAAGLRYRERGGIVDVAEPVR